MKKIAFVGLLLMVGFAYGQQKRFVPKMGKALIAELQMNQYEKDTTANALVLEEYAHTYLSEADELDFRTDHYYRVKLFDRDAFDRATIKVLLYGKQKIDDIDAFSYQWINGKIKKVQLNKKEIYTKDLDTKWREVAFTIPNIQEGSVIEYKYSVVSPYSKIDDWFFQSDIPKLSSNYRFTYLGNYKYNVRLVGFQKLDRTDAKLKKDCVEVPGLGVGSCGVLTYGMDNIAAFKEEDYMLSKSNFISHIIFDLISFTNPNGSVKKYTQTWKDADRSFKKFYLDGQTNKQKYFAKSLPQELLAIQDPLTRAKGVYKHIQERFSWNGRYWDYGKIKVKDSYDEKTGGVDAINLSLYNSLKAARIESYIVMIATRSKGIPTKLFPVNSDFNYIIVKAVIDGKTYFLDATDKFLFFGQIPMRCLNGEGRVLDFNKGSYWEPIKPILKNAMRIWAQLNVNEDNELIGKVNVTQRGYFARDTREKLSRTNEEQYLRDVEGRMLDYEVDEYKVSNRFNTEKSLVENFTLIPDEAIFGVNKIRVNPFFYFRISTNPFKLEERTYPVDFAYPRNYTYTVRIDVPEGYVVASLPKERAVGMPNETAALVFRTNQTGNVITLNYRFLINKKVFSSQEYYYLKEFYNEVIKLHKSYIEFQKI
jgi:hypothetical protein